MSPTSGPGLQAQASTRSISKFKLCWVELDRKTVWKFLDFLIEKNSLSWIFFLFFFKNFFPPKKISHFFVSIQTNLVPVNCDSCLSMVQQFLGRRFQEFQSTEKEEKKVKLWTQIFGLTWNLSNVWNFWKKIVNFRFKMSFQFFKDCLF